MTARSSISRPSPEALVILAIVTASLLLRYIVVVLFPVTPESDFGDYLNFARSIKETVWSQGTYYWDLRSPGMPTALALLSIVIPIDWADLGRWSTATLGGLAPLIVWLLWRNVVPLRARLLAPALLAFWPGQLLTCALVSHDTWAAIPAIALAALAVRAWTLKQSHPVSGVATWIICIWIRPEMLVVLMPVMAVTVLAGWADRPTLYRAMAKATLAAVIGLSVVAGQRAAGGGGFRLSAQVKGFGLVSTVRPGVYPIEVSGPVEALAFVECNAPLREPGEHIDDFMWRLGLRELERRPEYHAVRAYWATASSWWQEGAGTTYWSLHEGMPAEARPRAARLEATVGPMTEKWNFVIHTLALAAALLALWWRSVPLLAITAALLLKAAVHALLVAVPRYFVFSVGLEYILIVMVIDQTMSPPRRGALRAAAVSLVVAAVCMTGLTRARWAAIDYLEKTTERIDGCRVLPPPP